MCAADYLPLEGLLNVFARILPSTNKSASGRAQRTSFIQAVFKFTAPPELCEAGGDICSILQNVVTSRWEDTALRIVDVLARASIA